MADGAAASVPPPIPLLGLRSKDHGAQVLQGLPDAVSPVPQLQDNEGECRCIVFSSDGSRVAWCNSKCVKVLSVPDGQLLCTLPRPRTTAMEFSPKGNYLSTWETYAVKEGQQGQDNVTIWKLESGEAVRSYVHRRNDSWQPQWTPDDSTMALMVSSGVMFYKAADIQTCTLHVKVENIAAFQLAPSSNNLTFSCFITGKKGMPSAARLYTAPNYGLAVCNKSFFNADKVAMTWNKQGSAVLINTTSDVDKTGQSYYGETHMYFMAPKDGSAISILLDKNGPIYDCCWAPNGKEFAIVYGFMPAKVSLFNRNCDVIKEYGTGPRNVVSFNPSGTILCIAGFGNLRGEIEFWDRSTHTCVSKLKAPDSTTFAWCPDSRHIVTATTSPRLKVDNGVKVWHYTRGLLWKQSVQELWGVAWQPVPAEQYPTRPVSPVPDKPVLDESKGAAAAPAVYRPPGARGAPSKFSIHDKPQPTAAAAADANKPSKSQIKKQKAKAKAEAEAAAAAGDTTPSSAPASSAEVGAESKPSEAATASAADIEKKLRNLKKKLRAIDELKAKRDAGTQLEPEQETKVAGEAELSKEVAELEKSLAAMQAS